MASGVIIVLLGEERLKKYEYAAWKKKYEFSLVFGISTDTYDGLGLVTGVEPPREFTKKEMEEKINGLIGKYQQEVPIYSTKMINGLHLHEYARRKLPVELPKKSGRIYSLKLKSMVKRSTASLIKEIFARIDLINGDFRQAEVKRKWLGVLPRRNLPEKLVTTRLIVETSKGIYIRSLSQDIGRLLGSQCFCHDIVRTHNGTYHQENSKTLAETFGKNYKKVYDFQSQHRITVVK